MQESIILCRNDKMKVMPFREKLSEEDLRKLEKKYSPNDCSVLINCGDSVYYKLPLKSYLKLCNIARMIVSMELYAEDDIDQDPYLIQEFDQVILSINNLMSFVIYVRSLIAGVAETQAQACGFTYHKYRFRTVVIDADGEAKAFKGDFNEVLKEYGITPLL